MNAVVKSSTSSIRQARDSLRRLASAKEGEDGEHEDNLKDELAGIVAKLPQYLKSLEDIKELFDFKPEELVREETLQKIIGECKSFYKDIFSGQSRISDPTQYLLVITNDQIPDSILNKLLPKDFNVEFLCSIENSSIIKRLAKYIGQKSELGKLAQEIIGGDKKGTWFDSFAHLDGASLELKEVLANSNKRPSNKELGLPQKVIFCSEKPEVRGLVMEEVASGKVREDLLRSLAASNSNFSFEALLIAFYNRKITLIATLVAAAEAISRKVDIKSNEDFEIRKLKYLVDANYFRACQILSKETGLSFIKCFTNPSLVRFYRFLAAIALKDSGYGEHSAFRIRDALYNFQEYPAGVRPFAESHYRKLCVLKTFNPDEQPLHK